jgi:hypothetical protein
MNHRTITVTTDTQSLDLHLARLQRELKTITPDTLMSLKVWRELARLKGVIDETLSRVDEGEHTITY